MRLISSEFFIDCKSGGTGEQNISQQAFVPTAVSFKVMCVRVDIVFSSLWKNKEKKTHETFHDLLRPFRAFKNITELSSIKSK